MTDSRLPRENVYRCQKCGGYYVTVDVDVGVTPFMMDCKATPGCDGDAHSSFYPFSATPRPPGMKDPEWEWYKPSKRWIKRMFRTDPATADHCARGGLLLRPRTGKLPLYHPVFTGPPTPSQSPSGGS